MGKILIGLYSLAFFGLVNFGIGIIVDVFHPSGHRPLLSDLFIRSTYSFFITSKANFNILLVIPSSVPFLLGNLITICSSSLGLIIIKFSIISLPSTLYIDSMFTYALSLHSTIDSIILSMLCT